MQDSTVKTVDRVAAILRALGGAEAGLQLADIAERTRLAKPTAHRLLAALAEVGFAFQDLGSRRYRLGAGAAAIGRSAVRQHVAGVVQPALDRLAQATGDTAFASVNEGTAAICVARAVGPYPIRTLTLEIGDRRPLGVGAGSLALLSCLPDEEIARAIRLNVGWLASYPGFDDAELHALVARTRRDGYALNEGRIVAAMGAIAVVVRDRAGGPFVALSLAAIRERMAPDRLPDLAALLRQEGADLQASLVAQE